MLQDHVKLFKVDQVNINPLAEENKLKLIAYIAGTPFNLETLLPIDLNKHSTAAEACQAYLDGGCDLKSLLSANPLLKWTAVSQSNPSKSPYAYFTFVEQDGKFVSNIEDDEINEIIRKLVLEFHSQVESVINFGFNADIIKSVFLGAEDSRFTGGVNCIDFEELLKLKSLEYYGHVTIKSTKLIDQNKVKVGFTYETVGMDHEDYLSIDSTVMLNVDYSTRTVSLRRILERGFTPYFYDDEECRHLPMEMPEFLDNLQLDMSNNEIFDIDLADQALERIICSDVVLNKISNLVF